MCIMMSIFLLFASVPFLSASPADHTSHERREFLTESYSSQYCDELSFAYGDGLMSEGVTAAIDELVKGLNLCGKTVLDFGSGMGGMARHLAENCDAQVVGIDINERMIVDASSRIPHALKPRISFMLSNEDGSFPVPDNSVDVVLSKGVIVHLTVAERERAYAEFFRVLKPGGALVVNDWLSPHSGVWGEKMERLIENESLPLYAQTVAEYTALIERAGFASPQCTDQTDNYAAYNRSLQKYLEGASQQESFVARFGKES